MKEQLKQFIRDQAFLGLALVERLPQLHAEYEDCVSTLTMPRSALTGPTSMRTTLSARSGRSKS